MKGFDKYVARWVKDLTNKDDNPTTRMMGSICYMIYLTGMRIGTRIKTAASVKGIMTYGAMSLRYEHIRLNAQSITIQYPGKKNVPQKHIITVNTPQTKQLYKNLQEFMKGKSKGDIIFSYMYKTGTEKTMNTGVLSVYLKSVGFPAGIHKVRHARGTQFVIDALAKNTWKPSLKANTTLKKQKEAEDWFKKKILEPVAGFLGHKSGGDKLLWKTSVQNYCNPQPIKDWFEAQQLRIPKWVPLKEEKEEASLPC
jgi:DNA topoisomerase IB